MAWLLDITGRGGAHLLNAAARHGDVRIVEALLDAGVNVAAKDYAGVTPIATCERHGASYDERCQRVLRDINR